VVYVEKPGGMAFGAGKKRRRSPLWPKRKGIGPPRPVLEADFLSFIFFLFQVFWHILISLIAVVIEKYPRGGVFLARGAFYA